MPVGIRVKSGNVRIIACDIDGWNGSAVQAVGDDAACTVLIDGSYLGATRYDVSSASVAFGANVVQVSKKNQTAPHLATVTVRNTQIDPDIEAHAGSSISVGTSCVSQVTLTNLTFSQSVAGTPNETFFEDFPTLITAGGLSRTTVFGAPKTRSAVQPSGIPSSSTISESGNIAQQQFARPTGLARTTVFGFQKVVRGGAPATPITGAGAIPTHLAIGAATLRRVTINLRPAGLARVTAFGRPTVAKSVVVVQPTGIARTTRFGLPGLGTAGRVSPTGIPTHLAFGASRLHPVVSVTAVGGIARTTIFGAPRVAFVLRPFGIVSRLAFGTARAFIQSRTITPTGIPSRVAFGSLLVTHSARITAAGGIAPHRAIGAPSVTRSTFRVLAPLGFTRKTLFGIPNVMPLFGPSEAFGSILGESSVENAIIATLSNEYESGGTWLGAYLDETTRQAFSKIPHPYPATYRALTDPSKVSPGPLPQVTVVAAVDGEPEVHSESISIRYAVEVGFKVETGDHASARRVGHAYLSAISAVLTHRGSLGGFAESTRITGRSLDTPLEAPDKKVVTGSVSLTVIVEDAQSRYGWIDEPPAPGSPPPGNMPVTLIDITVPAS